VTWVRLDDSFADHPKLKRAGPLAQLVQVRALCYAGRYLTDGFVPHSVVRDFLWGFDEIGVLTGGIPGLVDVGQDAEHIDWAERLVENGVWSEVEGGYMIHDYLRYNPSKKDVLRLRRVRQHAGKKGGSRKAKGEANAKRLPHALLRSPTPTPTPNRTTEELTTLSSSSDEPRPPVAAREILNFLNQKAGRSFRPVPANLKLIEARLRSGASMADCRGVIARKVREWQGDAKMAKFLRPATLFNATNFEQYLGEKAPEHG
jgi:uncharacterized phage protein (TIGR02220 family)